MTSPPLSTPIKIKYNSNHGKRSSMVNMNKLFLFIWEGLFDSVFTNIINENSD